MDNAVNIGIRERKTRQFLGIIFLLIALVAILIFRQSETNYWWGLVLFPVWYQGIRFLLDFKTGTCPLKAELGQKKLDAFMSVFGEKIEDKELVLKIRSKSRKAIVWAVSAAIVLTAFSIFMIIW